MTRIVTTEPALEDVIRTWIAQAFRDGRREGLEPTTPLVTSGIVDSAGVIELVEWLERRFDVRIADGDVVLESFDTLEGLAALVVSKRAEPRAGA